MENKMENKMEKTRKKTSKKIWTLFCVFKKFFFEMKK